MNHKKTKSNFASQASSATVRLYERLVDAQVKKPFSQRANTIDRYGQDCSVSSERQHLSSSDTSCGYPRGQSDRILYPTSRNHKTDDKSRRARSNTARKTSQIVVKRPVRSKSSAISASDDQQGAAFTEQHSSNWGQSLIPVECTDRVVCLNDRHFLVRELNLINPNDDLHVTQEELCKLVEQSKMLTRKYCTCKEPSEEEEKSIYDFSQPSEDHRALSVVLEDKNQKNGPERREKDDQVDDNVLGDRLVTTPGNDSSPHDEGCQNWSNHRGNQQNLDDIAEAAREVRAGSCQPSESRWNQRKLASELKYGYSSSNSQSSKSYVTLPSEFSNSYVTPTSETRLSQGTLISESSPGYTSQPSESGHSQQYLTSEASPYQVSLRGSKYDGRRILNLPPDALSPNSRRTQDPNASSSTTEVFQEPPLHVSMASTPPSPFSSQPVPIYITSTPMVPAQPRTPVNSPNESVKRDRHNMRNGTKMDGINGKGMKKNGTRAYGRHVNHGDKRDDNMVDIDQALITMTEISPEKTQRSDSPPLVTAITLKSPEDDISIVTVRRRRARRQGISPIATSTKIRPNQDLRVPSETSSVSYEGGMVPLQGHMAPQLRIVPFQTQLVPSRSSSVASQDSRSPAPKEKPAWADSPCRSHSSPTKEMVDEMKQYMNQRAKLYQSDEENSTTETTNLRMPVCKRSTGRSMTNVSKMTTNTTSTGRSSSTHARASSTNQSPASRTTLTGRSSSTVASSTDQSRASDSRSSKSIQKFSDKGHVVGRGRPVNGVCSNCILSCSCANPLTVPHFGRKLLENVTLTPQFDTELTPDGVILHIKYSVSEPTGLVRDVHAIFDMPLYRIRRIIVDGIEYISSINM
ncbi:unnamed protein product [Bursaphelenchus okinawaensis]|uniref:Uncharacterized protein n=1 Tax=Bursaphelenchus okinawaensis TaxID=465554 RepID=A0A811JR40_9BILA|nr:unnamed protein product [Bursaphelenchus okinawaensis]CAG9079627.1 unnamed protein product [Bursaphelenchus okinawaensis]